jgi:DNA polymerase III epsilon subunit-like protein
VIDTSNVVFLDTETTGLDPDRNEIWDLAFIRDGKEYEYKFSPDLTRADPIALKIGHFYERTANLADEPRSSSSDARYLAEGIAHLLYGRHIVGACPSFDDAFLKRFMLVNGQARSTWHYHLIDVETLIAGRLGIEPPWKSDELSQKIGIEPPSDDERHTAIGDARWVKQMYEAVYALTAEESVDG